MPMMRMGSLPFGSSHTVLPRASPSGNNASARAWLASFVLLIGLIWWCAHNLTWDCTVIDETALNNALAHIDQAVQRGALAAEGLPEQGALAGDLHRERDAGRVCECRMFSR